VSTDICVRLGKRLRTLRKQREWTQVYMAEHVGMDRSFISDLENGRKEICFRNLELRCHDVRHEYLKAHVASVKAAPRVFRSYGPFGLNFAETETPPEPTHL
jgi:DNA-binding XRE family transcriptional regulator